MHMEPLSLSGTGLDEREIKTVLRCKSGEEMIRELRLCRCRVLEDIHGRQQALDRLDYIIERLRKENSREAQP